PSRLYLALLVGWGILVAGFGSFAWQWPALHHRHLRYRVDTSGVRIRRGVLWRKIISIPTTRVQHTDVTQGPLQRNYGLATLTVHTAGTQSASIALSGLSHEVALRLRDHLLPGKSDGA
ncbi:MAG: PH domain-containing protein, partial [Acidobacteria bacterium]|nr:PH domain-containing protein [Acidobacteriota bacterium]